MNVHKAPLLAVAVASVVAMAGCGGSEDQAAQETKKSVASSADVKQQVEQVCRAAGKEFAALPQPLDTNAAAEDQRRTAQILTTSVGKLNELQNDAGLPASYLSWLAAYRQLPAINQRAAEAFAGSGLASGQAAQAGQEWEAQAEKANSLARDAGLDDCVLDDAQGS